MSVEQLLKEYRYSVETIALKRMFPQTLKMAIDFDPYLEHLVLEMKRKILAWRSESTLTVKYPANWWQHFKQRWFPQWALQRWPVLLIEEHYKAIAYLPSLPVPEDRHYDSVFYGWKREDE